MSSSKSDRNLSAWEWRVVATAVRLGSWEAAASKLDLANPYVVERIVRRLEQDLGGVRLLRENEDGRVVLADSRFKALIGRAEDALDELDFIRRRVAEDSDTVAYRIRLDMYPGHVESFGAAVIGEFERSSTGTGFRLELAPSFGAARADGGIDLIRHLEDRRTDLVIAPVGAVRSSSAEVWSSDWDDRQSEKASQESELTPGPRPLWVRPLYRWVLLAAVGEAGRRALGVDNPSERFLDAAELYSNDRERPPKVMTSPPGHSTRELLDAQRPPGRRIEIDTTSDEPAALIELGRHTDRIPIVASDSFAPSPSTTELSEARKHWLTLTASHNDVPRAIGGAYGVFWREAHQPRRLIPGLRDLARRLADAGSDVAAKTLEIHLGSRESRPRFSPNIEAQWDRLRGGLG